ncbi:MAG: type II toxin-antitoxin system HicB family antitoxin [Bryobacteraceae bacterium]|jgi:predicted RNase H-like HicB family nuclease
MKRPFAASVWREANWYVSQCLEVDVASQGETEEEALANLKEALELHFEPPQATRLEVRAKTRPGHRHGHRAQEV